MRRHYQVKKETRLLLITCCNQDDFIVALVFRANRLEGISLLFNIAELESMPELGEVKFFSLLKCRTMEALKVFDKLTYIDINDVEVWRKSLALRICDEISKLLPRII